LDEHRADLPARLADARRVEILDEDALVLPSIADGSVTAVVTDPPWGEHAELDVPYEDFAKAMVTNLERVLHPRHGRLVLLLGRRVAYRVSSVWDSSPLRLRDSYDILVNGHPASVLVGGR
jgi:tRNA G10  N-methylase Trm11